MGINLLDFHKVDTKRLPNDKPTLLMLPYSSVNLTWDEARGCFGGKFLYEKERMKIARFINFPMQFYMLVHEQINFVMVTNGFGSILTRPSELLDGRYSAQNFHAAIHNDVCTTLELDNKRKESNIAHLFTLEDLSDDVVFLADSKKATTYFSLPEEDLPEWTVPYQKLGTLVDIVRRSKNAAPGNISVGLLTATGILYKLEESEGVVKHTAFACLSL